MLYPLAHASDPNSDLRLRRYYFQPSHPHPQKATYRSSSDSSRSKQNKQRERQAEALTDLLRLRLDLNKKNNGEALDNYLPSKSTVHCV